MQILFLVIICIVFSTECFAKSLMYSDREIKFILDKRNGGKSKKIAHQQISDCIKCNGILYQDSNNWSIWLSGRKFTNQKSCCELAKIKVLETFHNKAKISWTHKGKVHEFIISPGQIYSTVAN